MRTPKITAFADVELARRAINRGKNQFYEDLHRGDVPGVIRLGKRYFISKPLFKQATGVDLDEFEERLRKQNSRDGAEAA